MKKPALAVLMALSLALPVHAADPAKAKAPETTVKSEREFFEKAAQGGMAEVQMADAALAKAQRKDVKDFAYMMSNDHGSTNAALASLAAKKNVTLPTALDDKHAAAVKKLREGEINTFDRDYIKANIAAHEDAIALFKSAAEHAEDADVQAFAQNTLPTLQKHLDTIQAIAKK